MKQTAMCIVGLSLLLVMGCTSADPEEKIFKDLCSKAEDVTMYAHDFVNGQDNVTVKRMHFGVDNTTQLVKTTWEKNGTAHMLLLDASYYYLYTPSTNVGYKTAVPLQPAAQPYPSAACVPQAFGALFAGEDVVKGRPCYLINYTIGQYKGAGECYDQETGVRVDTRIGNLTVIYYDNYAFDLDLAEFRLPTEAQITEISQDEFFEKVDES